MTAAAGRTCDTMSAEVAPVDASNDRFVARPVRYCEICSFPYEYCEYGSSLSRCKANLEAKDPDLFRQLYSDEALEDKLKSLTTEQAESLERESAKKERKAAAKAEKERAQLAASKIVLSRVARTKRKVITCIHGLHQFSPPMPALKVIAKGYVALLTQPELALRYGCLGHAKRAAPRRRRNSYPGRRRPRGHHSDCAAHQAV